jgi:hypothetical protein
MICMTLTAAVPLMAAGEYMGGEIQLGGSGPYTIRVTEITTAVTLPVQSVPVAAATGSLSVATTPPGALVLVDGIGKGTSPATISGLAPGTHTLVLKMNGFDDVTAQVILAAGQTQTFTAVLPQASAAAATPSAPAPNKTPGFGAILGIAAPGAVLLIKKISPLFRA